MSNNRSSGQGFHSNLFKQYGATFSPSSLEVLDTEAYHYELNQESKLAEREKFIGDLQRDLDTTKEKLKKLQQSRFKSQERELAMADSDIAKKYETLIENIKTMVLNLTRPIDGNGKNLLNVMRQSTQYQEGLQSILEPNISVQQFVGMMEQVKSPGKLLAFMLRAIILNILRRHLFDSNVFQCIGGDNWKMLRGVYCALMAESYTQQEPGTEESDILVAPGNDRIRRDASLWRSQTLVTLDRNKDRLGLREGRDKLLQNLVSMIDELLSPLTTLQNAKAKEEHKTDIVSLVELAATLSIAFGKQRAMFELEPKKYIGNKYSRPIMEGVGPWAIDGDDEDEASAAKDQPFDVIAVVSPALYKFGNDDGEDFDSSRVVSRAQVLVIPTEYVEKPQSHPPSGTPATAESAPANTNTAPTTASDEMQVDPCADSQGAPLPKAGEQMQSPPVPPKDEIPQGEKPASKEISGAPEQKVLSADIKKDAQKVRDNIQGSGRTSSKLRSSDSQSRKAKQK